MPWSLLGQASAGKEVEAREAVAWQAPVGPSDDGIRGSMDASAPDERKTPVTGVLIFVGRAERPGVRHQDRCATVALCAHRRRPGRHHLHDRPLKPIGPPHGRRTARVAAGKQRRGRASRALRIPADDAAFPCVISIRFQSFLNFVLSIPLGLSRDKIWREKLFLGLVQIEINLCALLSFCTKPRKSFSRQIFSLEGGGTNQVESKIFINLPGKSAAFSTAAADFPSPCGGLQPTCSARGGVTLARRAVLQGPSAPMRPYLPAGGGASGSRGGNPPCRRLSRARVLAGGRRAEERLCGCAGCRYRATDCGAGLVILWDASAIELPVRFAHCARRWERISPQAQGTLRGQVHLGSAFRA